MSSVIRQMWMEISLTINCNRAVIAYTLKWELMKPGGQTLTQTRSYTTLWKLMGVEGPDRDGNIIRPNSSAIATPSNLDPTQIAESIADGSTELQASIEDTREELASYTGITVALDGVFFDDGAFVGPDSTGYFLKVKALRDARRDLYLELKRSRSQGQPSVQALQRVEEIASDPAGTPRSSMAPDDYYKRCRKDAALELLRIRTASGDDKAVEHAIKLLNNKWLDLKKL